jgi:hypothetical protein
MYIRKVDWDVMDWINVVHFRDQWRVLVNMIMKLQVP